MRLLEDRGAPSPCWGALRPGPNVRAPPGMGQACSPAPPTRHKGQPPPLPEPSCPSPTRTLGVRSGGPRTGCPSARAFLGAAALSPIQAKERAEGGGRDPRFPSLGSAPLMPCARAPGRVLVARSGAQAGGRAAGLRGSLWTLASLLLQMGTLDRPDVLKGAKPRACSATAAGPRTQSSVGQGLVTCRSSLHPQGPTQGPTCVTGQGGVWSTPQAVSLL